MLTNFNFLLSKQMPKLQNDILRDNYIFKIIIFIPQKCSFLNFLLS